MNASWRSCIAFALTVLAACSPKGPGPVVAGAPAQDSQPTSGPQLAPSTDGVPIAWRSSGHGEPAVVLIHGWGTDSSLWQNQISMLAAQSTVVTLDLAGQGASGANRSGWTLPRFAQDVAAVVAKLPNARIVLVGDGMGGPVALEAAPLIGTRVRGIIGVATFRTLGQALPSPAQTDRDLKPFRADYAGEVQRYVGSTLMHPQTSPALVRTVTALMGQVPPDRAIAQLVELSRLDYAAVLPLVKVPVVVIDSDSGSAIDPARLQKAIPGARLITLAGDDSFPMLDDVPRFNATLQQAIAQLSPR